MKSKQLPVLAFLLLMLMTKGFSQDITGTWEGLYGTADVFNNARGMNYHWGKDSLFVHMDLHQQGRKITGQFYYADIGHRDQPFAIYKISGLLDKKNPFSFFRLIMDGMVKDNTPHKYGTQYFH
jgi:hypothetical protein